MKKLKIEKEQKADTVFIKFTGSIDEDVDFSELVSTQSEKYVFDFDHVALINSCGIREWIKYLDQIKFKDMIYKNCPQIIIEQINMVHGFIKPGCKLQSFYAPYFCESCDKEVKVHLLSASIRSKKAPAENCPDCNEQLEFDALEASYFNFLGK